MKKPFKKRVDDSWTDKITMPFSSDAEDGVLSCFLHNPSDLLSDAIASVPVESFYHPVKRLLYEVILEMFQEGRPVEYIALSQRISDKGLMDKIGGQGTIAGLLDFVPTPAHYGYYKGILRDKALARKAILAGIDMIEAAQSHQDDMSVLVESCTSSLSCIIELARGEKEESFHDVVNKFEETWTEQYHGRQRSSIPSRWKEWDSVFGGILPQFHIFKGKTSHGKTSLALNVLKTIAIDRNEPCLWFPYEMSKESLIKRLISDMESVDTRCLFAPDVFKPTPGEMRKIARAKEKLLDAPIQLVKERGMNAAFIANKSRSFMAKHGHVGLIGIDYLQKIDTPDWAGRNDNSSERLAYNCDQCFKLQQEIGCAMIMISSTNAEGGTLGSQGADYDTDIAVEISREVGVTVKKNRNGGGVGQTIPLKFNGQFVRFEGQHPSDEMP